MTDPTYKLITTDADARRGEVTTPHGTFQTPAFMPVGTSGAVKALTAEDLEECGAEIILGNTYHLYLRPGVDIIKSQGGLASFNGWNKPTLTDSGGYQVFSMRDNLKITDDGVQFRSHHDGSTHMFTPERVMEIQHAIGADIIMAFDQCVPYPADRDLAETGVRRTYDWARRCLAEHERLGQTGASAAHGNERIGQTGASAAHGNEKTGQTGASAAHGKLGQTGTSAAHGKLGQTGTSAAHGNDGADGDVCRPQNQLFGIVQGSTYKDLRTQSAEQIVSLDFPGNAIGGLSVGESKVEMEEMLVHTIEHLPHDKPRYLMGVGYPEDILMAVSYGIDMFDCVLPTRNARTGNVFTSVGQITYRNADYADDSTPLDPNCDCRVCRRYSRAYIRHLYNQSEITGMVLATYHSTYFYQNLMRGIRKAIEEQRFESFKADFLNRHERRS